MTIHGDGFILRTTQAGPGGTPTVDPPLEQQYHAWLDGVALEAVTWLDSNTLQATVPGGLPAGKKTLVVENAFGSRGQLEGAYEVLPVSAMDAAIAATPSTVSLGQAITLTLTVTNVGGADLTGVTPAAPTISSTDGATADLVGGPTPATVATLAPGASRDFTWVYAPTAAGTLDMSASASGEDASASASVTSNAPSTSVTIQAGAALTVPLVLSPPTASVGQTITMVMTVTNNGDTGVNDVTPGPPTVTTSDTGAATLATGPIPTSVGFLAPGDSATFTWTFTATAAGQLTFSVSASGKDANSGATVSGNTTATNAVLVQTAPTLGGAMSAPATVSTNQGFTLTLTFTKGGTAQANVTAVTNPAGCANPTPATRTNVQTGQTITWSCTAPTTAQTLSPTSTVSWVDANNPGTTLTFTPAAASVAVVAGATLTGTMSAPATVSTSQGFTLTLTFTKGGAPQANVTTVTNPAGCVNPTPATLTNVQTGQTITWSCTAPATAQ
ncbi:MAG TPA: hypothetical protein VFF02_01360, partial [Anaeromyxobacteraceae bacterium]|nr:hypothetical protein [Anaeromyxobacteraceae bacterium]